MSQFFERSDPQINFGHLEAGDLKAEVETEQGEVLELLRQYLVVPVGELAQAVVADHEGAELSWAQVIEAEGWHFGNAKLAAGRQPAVPSDHIKFGIDQNRNVEAECLNAIGELKNLFLAVVTGVSRIRLHFADRPIDDLKALATFIMIKRFVHLKNPKNWRRLYLPAPL